MSKIVKKLGIYFTDSESVTHTVDSVVFHDTSVVYWRTVGVEESEKGKPFDIKGVVSLANTYEVLYWEETVNE